MNKVRKAIIPIAGLGTRFLPLSKAVPKELWPLVDIPVIQYIIEEAKASGIKEIIFVISAEKRVVLDYFKESPKIEKILKDRKKTNLLEEFKRLQETLKDISFSCVTQRKPLGDGHAVLQAAKAVGDEPCAVLFSDDVVDSETPCLSQLTKTFNACQRPILSLYKLPKERLPFYGIVDVEKIASRLYKIKKIVEKPAVDEAPFYPVRGFASNGAGLAIVGKYILIPEVFDYLARAKPSPKGEIILADVFDKMIRDGKIIYGYEFEGKWLECGNKLGWLKAHLYLSLKHPQFGPAIKKYLKEIK